MPAPETQPGGSRIDPLPNPVAGGPLDIRVSQADGDDVACRESSSPGVTNASDQGSLLPSSDVRRRDPGRMHEQPSSQGGSTLGHERRDAEIEEYQEQHSQL